MPDYNLPGGVSVADLDRKYGPCCSCACDEDCDCLGGECGGDCWCDDFEEWEDDDLDLDDE